MSNEQVLECWEREKERLAALGHQWSLEDAFRFSLQLAGAWKKPASVVGKAA